MNLPVVPRRAMLIGSLAMATAATLAACGKDSGSGSGSGDGATADKLTYWLSGDANEGGGFAYLAEKYEKETGTKIEIVDVPFDDFMDKLKNSALANDLPDIGRVPTLDPVWLDDCLDLTDVAESRNIMKRYLVPDEDGNVKAIPDAVTAVGLFINKSLFDQAGVAYKTSVDDTWTWDEFVEAVKQVQAGTGCKYGVVMDATAHRLRSFLYQFGSNGFQKGDDGKYFTNDKTKGAFEYLKGLMDEGTMPSSVWLSSDDPSSMFKSGEVAAYYSGVWQVANFHENIKDFEWVSAPMPKEPVQCTNVGAGGVMVAIDTNGNGEAAKAFIDWMYKPENYSELLVRAGALPVVEGAEPKYEFGQESFDMYNAEIAVADPELSFYQQKERLSEAYLGRALEGDPLKDETIKYLNNEQDADATIANVIKLMNEQLGS